MIELLNAKKQHILCVRGNCDAEVDQMVLQFPIMADYCAIADGDTLIYATHGHTYNEQNLPPLHRGDILPVSYTHLDVYKRQLQYGITINFFSFRKTINVFIY